MTVQYVSNTSCDEAIYILYFFTGSCQIIVHRWIRNKYMVLWRFWKTLQNMGGWKTTLSQYEKSRLFYPHRDSQPYLPVNTRYYQNLTLYWRNLIMLSISHITRLVYDFGRFSFHYRHRSKSAGVVEKKRWGIAFVYFVDDFIQSHGSHGSPILW